MSEMPPAPNRPVYLDNQATTRCDPRVMEAMLPYFTEEYGNPHSVEHAMGRRAEAAVEDARHHVAALLGVEPREIIFTSGATEANNIAIKGAARFARGMEQHRKRVITVATEHKCVLEAVRELAAEGFEPAFLPVGADGLVAPDALANALRIPTLLVSIMAVNNETGVIQDMAALATLIKEAGALFHTDLAQAAGKIPLDLSMVDLASVSGHKFYGPKGIGALYVRRRPRVRLAPLFSGGGQERGLRSGTLPAPLIVGLGEASRLAVAERVAEASRLVYMRQALLDRLQRSIPGLKVNGSLSARVAGNLNLTFPQVTAEALMRAIPPLCVSTGSACSSAAIEPSYVLRAMGLSDQEAARTLRIGIGRFTLATDIDYAAAALTAAHDAVQQAATTVTFAEA